uniref:Uncharacterized protein n=1 Tax=Aegilops tauschii subsp. strangulata TaxID=200361 RepID=A0A453LCS9_AEGTS
MDPLACTWSMLGMMERNACLHISYPSHAWCHVKPQRYIVVRVCMHHQTKHLKLTTAGSHTYGAKAKDPPYICGVCCRQTAHFKHLELLTSHF